MRVLPVLLVLALAGCSTPADVGARDLEVQAFVRTLTVGAGRTSEVDLAMEPGAKATFNFTSTRPVQWDVHTHAGSAVETLAQGNAVEGNATWEAREGGVHSLLFRNGGDFVVQVHVQAQGQFSVLE